MVVLTRLDKAELVRADLQEKRTATMNELVSIVKKNYVRFSESAKESAAVETELSGLSGLMAELQVHSLSGIFFFFSF